MTSVENPPGAKSKNLTEEEAHMRVDAEMLGERSEPDGDKEDSEKEPAGDKEDSEKDDEKDNASPRCYLVFFHQGAFCLLD